MYRYPIVTSVSWILILGALASVRVASLWWAVIIVINVTIDVLIARCVYRSLA